MAGDNCVCVLASCRTERLLTTVAKVYVTRGRCLLCFSTTVRASLAQCAAAGQVQARHHDAPLSTQLCSPVPMWLLHPGRECCRSQSTTIRQPPSSCRSPLQHEHVRPSPVGPSLSLAQRSGTHCQTSSATHRYRSTVSVASLKHSCFQTKSSVHSALEIFVVDALYKSTFTYLLTYFICWKIQTIQQCINYMQVTCHIIISKVTHQVLHARLGWKWLA